MIVSAFVTRERGFLNLRRSLRSACPVGQRYSLASSSHWNALLDNVLSLRVVLSQTGTWGAISFSSIIQASIAADPYAVSPTRRRGLRSCRRSTRSIIVLVD